MNRTEYRTARALVRANGNAAFSWIPPAHAAVFRELQDQGNDDLRIRARLEPNNAKLRLALWPICSAIFEPTLIAGIKARAMAKVRISEHRAEWDTFFAGEWVAE